MRGFGFEGYKPDDKPRGGFDNLLKLFTELLGYTSGDAGEALSWLNELDKKYNITDNTYGMGDFIQELKDKGYLTDDNPEGGFKITPKTEQVIRKSALEEIFGKLKKSGKGNHKTTQSGPGDEKKC